MDKKEIRKIYINKRKTLSETEFESCTNAIVETAKELLKEIQPKSIHCFLAIKNKREINTFEILNYCWSNAIKTFIPISDFENNKMIFSSISRTTLLEINKWGIPEPKNGDSIAQDNPEVVFTPLLAYDKNGYRVGYGKGFYDRYFSEISSRPIIIGVSFFGPFEKLIPINQYDIPLNYCITPDGIIEF